MIQCHELFTIFKRTSTYLNTSPQPQTCTQPPYLEHHLSQSRMAAGNDDETEKQNFLFNTPRKSIAELVDCRQVNATIFYVTFLI